MKKKKIPRFYLVGNALKALRGRFTGILLLWPFIHYGHYKCGREFYEEQHKQTGQLVKNTRQK